MHENNVAAQQKKGKSLRRLKNGTVHLGSGMGVLKWVMGYSVASESHLESEIFWSFQMKKERLQNDSIVFI
jgi:hypothetical protein